MIQHWEDCPRQHKEQRMDAFKEALIIVAAFVAIVAGGIYIYNHTSAGCVDLYFYKTCGVATH